MMTTPRPKQLTTTPPLKTSALQARNRWLNPAPAQSHTASEIRELLRIQNA